MHLRYISSPTLVYALVAFSFAVFPIISEATVLNVPDEYGSIQAAIDATQAGDTVLVQPGTYYENLVVNEGHLVNLFSLYPLNGDPNYIWNTILDGNGAQIMSITGSDSPIHLNGLVLQNGVGAFGGAIVTNSDLSLTICVLRNNYATVSGGAISAYGATPKTITSAHCTYANNSAHDYAGVFFLNNVNLVSDHDLIFGNTANVAGVLAQHNPPVNISFDFCTVVDNSDDTGIGGMWNFGVYGDNGNNFPNQVTITNSIFRNAGYEAATLRTVAGHENIYNISYSDFDTDGGDHGILAQAAIDLNWGVGNFDVDPQIDGNHVITASSPCIDAANPNTDNDPDGTRADIGYYYYSHEAGPRTRYVPGVYATIQGAIDAASEGDEISVSAGTYNENLNFNGKDVSVIGDTDNPANVVVNGGDNGPVVIFQNSETSEALLSGFTLRNGTGLSLGGDTFGGGILCINATPSIQHCIIRENVAHYGAGVSSVGANSNPVLDFCVIEGNSSWVNTGGVGLFSQASVIMNDCVIQENSSSNWTGGVMADPGCSMSLNRCVVANNTTNNFGGGILLLTGASATILNSDIYGNSCNNDGGAIFMQAATLDLRNSIVWSNSPNEFRIWEDGAASNLNISYSDIDGGIGALIGNNRNLTWGDGNIDADPNFVDAANGDFHLQSPSPCFNASDPNSGTDPDGSRMEMGAYYYPNADQNPNRFDVPDEYGTIQAAIDATTNEGDTVLVSTGTYYEHLTVNKGFGINLYSNFVFSGDQSDIDNTIIDGSNDGQIMVVQPTDSPVELAGFVIQNGEGGFGGAIATNSPLSVAYCAFRNNHASNSGGAITTYGATTWTLTSTHCSYTGNSSNEYGGVFFLNNVNLVSDHDLMAGNTADVGGVLGQHNPPVSISFDFCTVVDNSDNYGIGGMWIFGVYGDNGNNYPNQVTITNSIFRNAGYEATNRRTVAGHPNIYTIAYSDVEDGQGGFQEYADYDMAWGAGNIDTDPAFADVGNGNYNLTITSRCLNAANPEAANDPDGTRADMGAFPFDLTNYPNWAFNLVAYVGNANDEDNFAGGALGASNGYDPDLDVPEPPIAPNNYVALYFPHPEWNAGDFADFSEDIKQLNAWEQGTVTWDFNVVTDIPNSDVELGFEYGRLPFSMRSVNHGMVDLTLDVLYNGVQRWIGDGDPYIYNSGDGGVRSFRMVFNDNDGPESSLESPAEGAEVVANEFVSIEWLASDVSTVSGSVLSISFNDGESWSQLADLDGDARSYNWQTYTNPIGSAILRLVTSDGFGNQSSVYRNIVIIDTPPVVTVTYPNSGEQFSAGTVIHFTWDQTDNIGVTNNVIHIWSNDALGYDEVINLEGVATSYDWTAPNFYSPFLNVAVFAYDVRNNEGSDESDAEFAVTTPELSHSFQPGWNLFSIPLNPANLSIASIVGDDANGAYFSFSYSEGGYTRDYELWRDLGYWLALNNGAEIDVQGTSSTGPADLGWETLELGWNLVGCPFPTAVPLSEFIFQYDGEAHNLSEAIDAGKISPVIYNWSQEDGSYVEANGLTPWSGSWFKTLEADVQVIVVPSRGQAQNTPVYRAVVADNNWNLSLMARMANSADLISYVGVTSDAGSGYDAYFDLPEPPNPPARGYVSAYFEHDNWNENYGSLFNSDVRAPIEAGSSDDWTLTVATGDTGVVTLTWSSIEQALPAGYSAVLTDVATGRQINLSEEESYSYFSNRSHTFTVTVAAPDAPQPRELRIPLRSGWNMISLNVTPGDEFFRNGEVRGPDVRRILDQLLNEQGETPVEIFKNEEGKFYVPRLGFNNITYWNLSQGYMLKVNQTVDFVQSGVAIPVTTPVPLEQGWNLIAYYPEYTLSARAPNFEVLSPIINDVILAKDQTGRFLSTRDNFSNMPDWTEGKGYQVKVRNDVELVYPEAGAQLGGLYSGDSQVGQSHWNAPASTGRNMSLLISGFVGIQVNPGDEIAAFDKNGQQVGWGVVDADRKCGIAVWGDETELEGRQGLSEGETFTLRLWQPSAQSEVSIEPRNVIEGDGLAYTTDGFSAVELKASIEIPNDFSLEDAYPNPFNSATTISFGLPERSNVRLSVVNLAGQTVAVLLAGEREAGRYNLRWNAQSVSSGVYFVRLEASGRILNHKVSLLK